MAAMPLSPGRITQSPSSFFQDRPLTVTLAGGFPPGARKRRRISRGTLRVGSWKAAVMLVVGKKPNAKCQLEPDASHSLSGFSAEFEFSD